MIQEIITYAIVLTALGAAGFRFYKTIAQFGRPYRQDHKCSGCSSANCALRNLPAARQCSLPNKTAGLL